ncbi:MAG: hypothetical protein ACOC0N_09920 [Chroococcales cyanobacterium]
MKALKKAVAGFFLTVGFFLLLVPAYVAIKENPTKQDKLDARSGLILGFPIMFWGIWLAQSAKKQNEDESSDRLQSIFYSLLEEGQGQVSVMRFAMESNLSSSEAERYLMAKAKEYDADFEVNHEGVIYYRFLL